MKHSNDNNENIKINEGGDNCIIINSLNENQNEEKRKDYSTQIKSCFKSGYYQYVTNNNCNTSNKSKDKETKSKQTKYLIGNNEALNHLIYFTNSLNKTGILPGTSSKTKSEVNNGNG